MSDLSTGNSFGTTEQVTATKLNNAVNNATILEGFISGKSAASSLASTDAFVFRQASTGELKQVQFQYITSSGLSATTLSVAQTSHGFSAGDIVYRSDATHFAKAKADAMATSYWLGVVSAVADADNFTLATSGYVSGLSGYTAAGVHYLSSGTAGAVTTTKPYNGNLAIPVFIAVTSSTIILLPFAIEESVGNVKYHGASTAPVGYVRLDAKTMGDGSSGGTERANVDCESLFKHLWENYADAQCAVSSGRGISSSADWSAHKTITLPDARGRALASLDNLGGSAASRLTTSATGFNANGSTIGTSGGSEEHQLTTTETPAHTHTPLGGGSFIEVGVGSTAGSGATNIWGTAATTSSVGSDGKHINVQPTIVIGGACMKL